MPTPTIQKRRPGPVQWLYYSYGGGLPADLQDWVLRDLTGRTWVGRQLVRTILVLVPIIAAFLILVPGPFWIRGTAVIGGTAMSLFFSAGFMIGTTEHRSVKAGFPPGTAEKARVSRSEAHYAAALAARRARAAARRERRRQHLTSK